MIKQLAAALKKIRIPYWPLIAVPYALLYFGVGLNQLVIVANHNQMPVDLPASMWQVCADPISPFIDDNDTIHSCMTKSTHLKILCDWIILGNPTPELIMSPGDVFIFLYEWLVGFIWYVWFSLVVRDYFGGTHVVQAEVQNSGSGSAPSRA